MTPLPSWLPSRKAQPMATGNRKHERNSLIPNAAPAGGVGGRGGSAAVQERRITSLTRQASEASESARRVAEETLGVATATLAELEMQTTGLSRVAMELESCEMSVVKVRGGSSAACRSFERSHTATPQNFILFVSSKAADIKRRGTTTK